MYPDTRISYLSKQSCSNYYKLLRDLKSHPCCLALGAGASVTVGLPTWDTLLKRICHCYFSQWAMKISSGEESTEHPPCDVSIALTNSYDLYLLEKEHPELLGFEKILCNAEYWVNGHKLSDEEARQQNDKMIRSNLLIRELQDSFMDKIMSGDLTVIAQMIKNNVRPKDWNYLLRKSIYSSYEDNPYVLHISPLYHALIKLTNRYGINTIINYNYDDTFYHALCECGYKFRNHYKNMDTHGDKRIYYPHGYIPMKGGVVTDIVLSEDDYQQQIYHQNLWSNNIQTSNFISSTCIFVGLSLNDSNIRRIINMGAQSGPYKHYAFLPMSGTDQVSIMYDSLCDADLYRLGIRVIRYPRNNNHEALPKLLNILCELN